MTVLEIGESYYAQLGRAEGETLAASCHKGQMTGAAMH